MNDYIKRVKDNKLLKIWYEMKRRCLNKDCKDYQVISKSQFYRLFK